MIHETRSIIDGRCTIHIGDCIEVMKTMPANSVDCVVTSPPYWGLRDYGVAGQIGLEPTLGEHLQVMVSVFEEVWRVLKPAGTLWLNYGDCYATTPNGKSAAAYKAEGNDDRTFRDKPFSTIGGVLKAKDLCMLPNRLAIALQEDGWYVRSEIIWHKPNPMPESVYDRPTSSHEKVWLLTKSEEYFYDHEAIREPVTGGTHNRRPGPNSRQNVDRVPVSRKKSNTGVGWGRLDKINPSESDRGRDRIGAKTVAPGQGIKNNSSFDAALDNHTSETRNARNVWSISPKAFSGAHFATFPPALAERCIKAGTPKRICACCGSSDSCGPICEVFGTEPGIVFDPFGGAGTVGLVAEELGLRSIMIELNPEYADIAIRRITPKQEDEVAA